MQDNQALGGIWAISGKKNSIGARWSKRSGSAKLSKKYSGENDNRPKIPHFRGKNHPYWKSLRNLGSKSFDSR